MENTHDTMKRMVDLLIKRGFSKGHVLNDRMGVGEFDWTPAGKSLRKHLLQLFDVPNAHPRGVNGHEVMTVIGMILFTGEPRI